MPTPPRRTFDGDTWRKLIGPALRVVDSLKDAGYGVLDFRLGGGTVLMFRFDHAGRPPACVWHGDAATRGGRRGRRAGQG